MKKPFLIPLSFLFLMIFTRAGFTQDLDELLGNDLEVPSPKTVSAFTGTRVGVAHSVESPYPGDLHFFIGHRFGSVDGGFYEMFGLDQATMRLGFDYGINRFLSAGFGRSSFEKTYDLYVKASLSRQAEEGFPFSSSLYVSNSVNTLRFIFPENRDGIADRSSFIAQAIIARKQGIFSVQVSPSWIYTSYDYRISESWDLFAMGLSGGIEISPRFSLTAEYFISLNSPPLPLSNPLTLGIDIDTGGHLFQLVAGNNTALTDKALLMNTTETAVSGKWFLGFNLIRTFYLKKS